MPYGQAQKAAGTADLQRKSPDHTEKLRLGKVVTVRTGSRIVPRAWAAGNVIASRLADAQRGMRSISHVNVLGFCVLSRRPKLTCVVRVSVVDTTAPALSLPSNIAAIATGLLGALGLPVSDLVMATDIVDL